MLKHREDRIRLQPEPLGNEPGGVLAGTDQAERRYTQEAAGAAFGWWAGMTREERAALILKFHAEANEKQAAKEAGREGKRRAMRGREVGLANQRRHEESPP